jgi:hypothetical protein
MFARVTLDLSSTRMAVMIPREALVYRGQQPGVYVLQSRKPMFQSIETGLTQGDKVEVLSKLDPGATIITRGATMIIEGDQIRVVNDAEPGRPRSREGPEKRAEMTRPSE